MATTPAETKRPTLLNSDGLRFDKPNLPNAAILMNSLRHLGYSNHSAIADLVDNSIDADAQRIAIGVEREKGDFVITIVDDGIGMDERVVDEATKLGSDTERNVASDLGLYGMGLVTASISIGRRLQVMTRAAGDTGVLVSVSDLDEVMSHNDFVKHQSRGSADEVRLFEEVLRRSEIEDAESGTIVSISKSDGMKYTSTGHFLNALKKHLSQTFRYYLAAGKSIMVNGEVLKPYDPLHLELEGVKVFSDDAYDFTFKTEEGVELTEKFRVKLVTLPDFGTDGNFERGFTLRGQGFYVLRNNREIAEAQTLGLFTRHSEFNLFRAELHVPATLDDVLGVNFTKREVKPNQAFLDKLRQVTGGQLKTIRAQRWKKRVATDEKSDQHDEAARLITAKSHLLVKPKAAVEKRSPRANGHTKPEQEPKDGTESARKNFRQTQLTASDLRVRFEQVSLGEGGQIFEAYQEGRTIIVQWNVDHPFYQRFVVENQADGGLITAIDFFIWAWASAELMVYKDGKTADLLDQMKTLISMNTRTLLK
jgi:Histidine kinase-, DNA gyrase B-, and HSP90-like ATPase